MRPSEISALPQYAVIVAPLPLQSGDPEEKLFVVISHERYEGRGFVLCMKATSQVALYLNNPERLVGAVLYRANETIFDRDTVIQPDNLHPIPYERVTRMLGTLPHGFHDRIVAAVKTSMQLTEHQRAILLRKLGVQEG